MPKPPTPSQPDFTHFARRISELRLGLARHDPLALAHNTGAAYQAQPNGQGDFSLPLWGRPALISFPDFVARQAESGEELSLINQALLLYYFSTADGAPVSERWIAFSELPDGRFYAQAYQGYTGAELARAFQDDLERFKRTAHSLGGTPYPLGDAAFAFWALPRVPLLAVFWRGDEDFPSSCQVLCDACASHYLPTDAYAILGSSLTRRLIAAQETT